MRRRQVELELSTAWAIARNEAAARGSPNLYNDRTHNNLKSTIQGDITTIEEDITTLNISPMWRVVGVWCRLMMTAILNEYVTVEW